MLLSITKGRNAGGFSKIEWDTKFGFKHFIECFYFVHFISKTLAQNSFIGVIFVHFINKTDSVTRNMDCKFLVTTVILL